MTGEQIALWLGIVSVAIVTLGAIARAILAVVRAVRGRVVRHREKTVREAVQPLITAQSEHVDAELTAIRHSQGELSDATGTLTKRVTALEVAITNGLTTTVAAMKDEQKRQGKRIDRIFDHLIED